jgi:hypothetical protein
MQTMTKIDFYKTMFNGPGKSPRYEKSQGYIIDYMVDGTIIKLIFEKCKHDWSITEYTSGLLIRRNFTTRKNAMESITPVLLQAISERLKNNKYITMLNEYRAKCAE